VGDDSACRAEEIVTHALAVSNSDLRIHEAIAELLRLDDAKRAR
jgi:hypothetical protein